MIAPQCHNGSALVSGVRPLQTQQLNQTGMEAVTEAGEEVSLNHTKVVIGKRRNEEHGASRESQCIGLSSLAAFSESERQIAIDKRGPRKYYRLYPKQALIHFSGPFGPVIGGGTTLGSYGLVGAIHWAGCSSPCPSSGYHNRRSLAPLDQ